MEAWVRHLAGAEAIRELRRVLEPTAFLAVKGIVTARTLYADLAERPIADVDVRVAGWRTLARVIRFARRRGHRLVRVSPVYDNVMVNVGGVDVDVECHVGPPGFCRMRVTDMLARSTVDEALFGVACAVPEVHDHALLMCVNAFKDKLVLVTPWAIEDLRRIARGPAFDPSRFARLAAAASSATVVWIVADYLAAEEPAWAEVRRLLGGDAPRRLAFARTFERLVLRSPTGLRLRVLARLAPDAVGLRASGLLWAAAWELERGLASATR